MPSIKIFKIGILILNCLQMSRSKITISKYLLEAIIGFVNATASSIKHGEWCLLVLYHHIACFFFFLVSLLCEVRRSIKAKMLFL